MSTSSTESSDKLFDSTNPDNANIILKGSTTIALALVGSIYTGSAQVQLPIDTTYTINDYKVYAALDFGAGGILYNQLGYAQFDTAGAFKRSGYTYISTSVKPYGQRLEIVLEEVSPLTPASTVTVYYVVYSTKIT